jgi:hypothetical protein
MTVPSLKSDAWVKIGITFYSHGALGMKDISMGSLLHVQMGLPLQAYT